MFKSKYTYIVEDMDAIQFARVLGTAYVKFDIGEPKRVKKPNSDREMSVRKFTIWTTHRKMADIIEKWVYLTTPAGI